MAGKTKYTVVYPFATKDRQYKAGEIAELTDAEARQFKVAIGLYLGADDEAPDDLPKPKKKVRSAKDKPASPVALADDQLLDPDPKAK